MGQADRCPSAVGAGSPGGGKAALFMMPDRNRRLASLPNGLLECREPFWVCSVSPLVVDAVGSWARLRSSEPVRPPVERLKVKMPTIHRGAVTPRIQRLTLHGNWLMSSPRGHGGPGNGRSESLSAWGRCCLRVSTSSRSPGRTQRCASRFISFRLKSCRSPLFTSISPLIHPLVPGRFTTLA